MAEARVARRSSYRLAERHSLLSSSTKEETIPLLSSNSSSDGYADLNPSHPVSHDQWRLLELFRMLRRQINLRRHRYCYARFPKGKGFLIVFVLTVLENFAFYGAVNGMLHFVLGSQATEDWGFFLTVGLQYCASRVFYPIAGFLADTYIGRYRTIQIGLSLLWLAFVLLTIALGLDSNIPSIISRYVIPIVAFVFVSLGAAAFEATMIPFGVDQLSQGASSDEMSSYFYWFYFARQLGMIGGLFTLIGIAFLDEEFSVLQPAIAVLVMTIAIVLLVSLQRWLFKDRRRENSIKLVGTILYYAATVKRHPPIRRRAFRYGEAWQPRIELAKFEYDGIYSSEDVEDVKTFCRILLVIFTISGVFASYSSAFVMLSYQISSKLEDTSPSLRSHTDLYLASNVFNLCNLLTLLVALPIMNHVVLPCFPLSTIKERLGFGAFLALLAAGSATYLQWATGTICATPACKLLWLLLPSAILAIAEMFIFVSGLEFIYAQSPESMKGLLTGLFYFVFGLFSGIAVLIFYQTPKIGVRGIDGILLFYAVCTIWGALGFTMYAITAYVYTNRQRPTVVDGVSVYNIV